MSATSDSNCGHSTSVVTWMLVIALLVLPVVWLNVYLFSPQEEDAEYFIGRYSLLLGAAGVIALIVERLRGYFPLAAVATTLLAWVGVVLGKVLAAGESAYPWIILAAGAVVALGAGVPGAYRSAAIRTAVVLVAVSGVGLLGLA